MRQLHTIYIFFILLTLSSCRDFNANFGGDTAVVKVGGKELRESELLTVVPQQFTGEDSTQFAQTYVSRWIKKQLKLREAEQLFSASQQDIESLVEEYRQSLLIRKLEESYIKSSIDTTYTDAQIEEYYNSHIENFKLNRDIVKYRILRFPEDYRSAKRLHELMESSSSSKQEDLLSICEKEEFEMEDATESWSDFSTLLDHLPLVRGGDYLALLSKRGIQQLKGNDYQYYFEVTDHLKVGDAAPLERVRETIRTILITERQQQLIKEREEQLLLQAEDLKLIELLYEDREQKKNNNEN